MTTESKNTELAVQLADEKSEDKPNRTGLSDEQLDEIVDEAMEELSQQYIFKSYLFFMSALSIAEAVIVGLEPTGANYKAQVVILAASTILFVIANFYVISYVTTKSLTWHQSFKAFITPGETKLEIVCFIVGWACIFENPGLAALRIFRVVRVLWYLELKGDSDDETSPFALVRKGGILVVNYLERIGKELFSTKTQGGTIVLLIYFYTIYTFSIVYWQNFKKYNGSNTNWYNNNTNQHACNSLNNCYNTIMRLSLYDGNGLDFLWNLTNSPYKGFAALLIVFMCFTAIVLLNGLIGIFSHAFTDPIDDDDDDDDEDGDENEDGDDATKKDKEDKDEDNKGDKEDDDKDKNKKGDEADNEKQAAMINDLADRLARIENLLLSLQQQQQQQQQ